MRPAFRSSRLLDCTRHSLLDPRRSRRNRRRADTSDEITSSVVLQATSKWQRVVWNQPRSKSGWGLRDQTTRLCLPVDVRFSPKAT
jgi:hypothetical protein